MQTGFEQPEVNGRGKAVATFLAAQPDVDIGQTSIYEALRNDTTIAAAPADLQPKIVSHLKALQRTHAISPDAKTAAKLIKRGLTSAYQIARQSRDGFVAADRKALAKTSSTKSMPTVDATIANEQALMAMHEAVNGTGIRAIDGSATKGERAANVQALFNRHGAPFVDGGVDRCTRYDFNLVFAGQDGPDHCRSVLQARGHQLRRSGRDPERDLNRK